MEIKEILRLIKNNLLVLSVFTVVGFLLAFFYSQNTKDSQSLEKLFYVSPKEQKELQETNVNNYTDSIVAILEDPAFSSEINIQRYQVRKIAPYIIKLSTTNQDLQALNVVSGELNIKLNSLTNNNPPFVLVEVTKNPSLVKNSASQEAYLFSGATIGLVLGLIVALFKNYFHL